MKGRVDIGTAVRVRSACARLHITVAVAINTQLPAVELDLGIADTAVNHATTDH